MVGLYVVEQAFAGHDEGEILKLTPEQAERLGDYVREADEDEAEGQEPEEISDDEADGAGDPDMENNAVVARAIKKVNAKLEKAVVKATSIAMNKVGNKAVKPNFPTVPATPKEKGVYGGIKGLGDLVRTIHSAHKGFDPIAQKKLNAYRASLKAVDGMGEGTNSKGGYAVIPEWEDMIWDKIRSRYNLLDYVTKKTVSGNTLNIPSINETSLADGSRFGGVLGYWISEGGSFTGSYPALTQTQLILNKLGVFTYFTEELLNDNAYNLDDDVADKAALEIEWQVNQALVNGSGSGQPTGIMNAAALKTVTSASTHGTFAYNDITAMWNALYYPCQKNAIWLINQQAQSQLLNMTFANASGTYPAFGAVSFNAHEEFPLRIFGRPVIVVQNCAQLGLTGDIILADLSQIHCITKPFEVAISTEYMFATDEVVFRFIFRIDAKSPWTSVLTLKDGVTTTSPFVVLSSRGT